MDRYANEYNVDLMKLINISYLYLDAFRTKRWIDRKIMYNLPSGVHYAYHSLKSLKPKDSSPYPSLDTTENEAMVNLVR